VSVLQNNNNKNMRDPLGPGEVRIDH